MVLVRRFILGTLLLTAVGSGAQTVAPAGPSQRTKVVLVELFTSEGCSDCPPADALLRQINGARTATGQLIVGISEHVTYWNRLGWADPFSAEEYTDRQNGYGESLKLESVYTPQMVVNGREQFVGSDRGSLERALQREQARAPVADVRIVSTIVEGGKLNVTFSADGDKSAHGAEVLAVLTDDLDQSNVLRGENSGRSLSHVAVARTMVRVGKLQSGEQQTAQLPLPASFRQKQGHHLVLFAQAPGQGGVLGADAVAVN
jgi:hypothetical protein